MIASRVSSLAAESTHELVNAMHREMLVAAQVRRFAQLEELGRDADTPFRCESNLFELTWQAWERERDAESGSKKKMSHPRRTLAGSGVFNNHRRKREPMLYVNHV
jgi:hypothetical protein